MKHRPDTKIRHVIIVADAVEEIEAQLSNGRVTLVSVAEALGVSAWHLSRLFKKQKKKTFSECVRHLQFKKAEKLLGDDHLKVKEIAFKSGFNNPNHFSSEFKKITGKTPTQYRANILRSEHEKKEARGKKERK